MMNRSARFVTIVPMVAIAGIMLVFAHPPWTNARIAGGVVAVAAFTLLTIARVQLGNAFSVTPQARFLVTSGIYSKIRHPVYVFSAIGICGLFVYLGMAKLLVMLVVLVPVQIIRARKEEAVLSQKFGGAYVRYRERTWF